MNAAGHASIALSIATAAVVIAAARRSLAGTTLLLAWNWAMGTIVVWIIAAIATVATAANSNHAVLDLLWYATALCGLCPAVAVLGARRPGVYAWTWFVLVPLVAVLGWPALTAWGVDLQPRAFRLEAPQLLGFLLVLVMGAGNYVGTKFWLAACLYGVGMCLWIAPLSTVSPPWLSPQVSRIAGSVATALAALAARAASGRTSQGVTWDRLWTDYRDQFGIVWGRRLQDRFNAVARDQGWPIELTSTGFRWTGDTSAATRETISPKVEQTLEWMLRRFVTPEWVSERLVETDLRPTDTPASTDTQRPMETPRPTETLRPMETLGSLETGRSLDSTTK